MWRANCALCLRLLERGRIRAWVSCQPRFCSNDAPESSTPSPPKANTSLRTKTEKQKRRQQKQTLILATPENVSFVCIYFADTSVPFPLSYSPEYVEASWYQWWEKEGFFTPEYHDRVPHAQNRTFTMCVPPPNVTGSLHLGHALTVAIEDAMVRWKRMQGYRVLWVPGCDHAGIATQVSVVEKRLLRDQRRRRQDLSREEFLQEVWTWKSQKGDEIYQQLRRLGASLDWSRACFTMDQGFSEAVTEAFVRLCDSGLIYRSEALVNWSCALESAISDIEVDSQELSGRTMLSVPGYERKVEFGTMVTFAYPLEGQEVAVATTRPETMLGDVAIAVHPDDPRYQAVQGKHCRHPFGDRLIPIVTDTMVDMQLGTGAVKVTPAHDHVDFELSRRHSLPCLTVISGDGTMAPSCGQWLEGVKRFDAREKVLDALAEKKLLRNKKDHAMSLPKCRYSRRRGHVHDKLPPWVTKRCVCSLSQAVEDGQLEIIPPLHIKTWKKWLSNTSDWCISRQLWWGHRIPAYQVALPGQSANREALWVWGRSEQQARERAAAQCGVDPASLTLTQDPDVLDTWFSSALFPFAMLGWPQKTPDLQQFYPTSVLETGSDILFFWVARMVMLGTELTGQLPFKQVLLHSLVRDRHGRKMSKSLGNVVDPLDVIAGASLEVGGEKVRGGNLDPGELTVAMEAQRRDFPGGIPECGTDALRFALCSHRAQGEDISLSVSQVLSYRRFCNKIWQTVRFTLGVLGDGAHQLDTLAEVGTFIQGFLAKNMDRWVCSRLHSTVLQCERGFEARELSAVTAAIHSFWVHSLCDVYMVRQLAVSRRSQCAARSVLYHCVSVPLALLAPFMPYLSEELWQRLHPLLTRGAGGGSSSLCLQPFPRSSDLVGTCHLSVKETMLQLHAIFMRHLSNITREGVLLY
uniref:Valine--tRNA ligase, mitochondrial n=1 Tax=Gadus morhua TaxID=8049 RepID=A0A8C5A2W1_GADMO